MRFSKVKEVFRKEILDTLRDRRTILMMIVVPVLLYPGLLIVITELTAAQQAKMEQRTIQVALIGVPDDSPLISKLRKAERIQIVQSKNPMKAVHEGKIHFVIEMPPQADEILERKGTLKIKLQFDQSNDDSMVNAERVRDILDEYGKEVLRERLQEKKITEQYVHPVDVAEVNVASKQKMGGFIIGRFLPMMMVIMVLMGAMYPSIDMTAGEKERGTLETILTSPATRTEIITGKFFTVTLIALITGLLNLGSMAATFVFGILKQVSNVIQFNIPPEYLLIMLTCLIPLAVFFAGLMMAVSSFARSFKDAQNILTPVYIVASVPALISTIPGIQLEGFWITVPIANVVLLYKELMLGVFLIEHIVGVFLCTAFFAGISLFVAVKLFGREEVLFGGVSSLGMSFRRANFLPRPVPDPSESLFLVMIAMILLLYVGIPLQAKNLISGLALTELLFFGALPVGLAYYLKLDLRTTFSLRTPSVISIVSAILFMVGILMASGTLVYYQNQFFPMPQKALEALEKLMRATTEHPFPVVLFLVAVLPAICEELSFRGFVLSGLLKRNKPLAAMIATAAFFAAFHLSLYRFVPTFLIGLAASFLVWRSRSIFTGMLLHFLNNGSIAFLNNYPQYDVLGLEQLKPSFSMFFSGLACVALGWFISYRRAR